MSERTSPSAESRPGHDPFPWIGGHPVLDFVNTLSGRLSDDPEDRLEAYVDLVRWGEEAGLLDAAAVRRARRFADSRPEVARRVLRRSRRFREALYRVLSAHAGRQRSPAGSMVVVNREIRSAATRVGLRLGKPAFRWVVDDNRSADALLHPIAWAAGELLTDSAWLDRLRECDSPPCSWLFLDTTRNRSRRWCIASACGNRERVKRHYWRSRVPGMESRSRAGHHASPGPA